MLVVKSGKKSSWTRGVLGLWLIASLIGWWMVWCSSPEIHLFQLYNILVYSSKGSFLICKRVLSRWVVGVNLSFIVFWIIWYMVSFFFIFFSRMHALYYLKYKISFLIYVCFHSIDIIGFDDYSGRELALIFLP